MSLKQYDVITKLGAGSFGVVYKAKLKRTNEIFVIKEIEMSRLDSRLKKWAMNEAKIMKQINSPYIVKYSNSFVQANKLFIVMQYCIKGDLCKFIKSQMGKPIKQQTIWRFTIQIMIGLHTLHSKKILHRDIKTLNIFLDENLNIRIGDLGTAKTLSTQFTHTIVGTPYYLSPEICQQKPYNQKTDIWAFGCMVYQLCTGRHPFEAQNQAALALKIVMGKFQDIPSFYSKDLRWLIQSCLSVDYKRRPSINFLLQRPFIIEQANKLNLNINQSNKVQNRVQTLPIQKITDEKKDKQLLQINALIKDVNKKVDQTVKKIQPSQKPPVNQVKQNGSKKDLKVNHHQNNKYSKKQVELIKKTHDSSLEKRKQIDMKKGKIPPTNEVKGSSFSKYPSQINQNKSKQKPKVQNTPLIQNNPKNVQKVPKVVPSQPNPTKNASVKKWPEIKKQTEIKKQIVTNAGIQKPKITQQPKNLMTQKGRFTPCLEIEQKKNLKSEFNTQDQKKLKKDESSLIMDLDMLDITQKSKQSIINDEYTILDQEWSRSVKKAAFVNNNIQREIDDDELMVEFGITPEKKNVLNDFSLMKTKSINWDLQSSKNSTLGQQILQKTKPNSNNQQKTTFKQLPTIRTNSQTEQVSFVHDIQQVQINTENEQNEDNDNYQQQEQDDNQPYRSDDDQDDQDNNNNKKKQSNENNSKQQVEGFQDDDDSKYLIENIQAQFAAQGKQALEKEIQNYSKRLLQNQKRLIHLEGLKNHTQRQYFSHLSKQTYQKLKQQINSENDKQVDRLMKQLTKGKQILVMKFLKIMGFEMEIQKCTENIKQSKQKLSELKIKLQQGDWI